MSRLKFIDLFAGIGGFHFAMKTVWPKSECVFASEIDKHAARTYENNHGVNPLNDITKTDIRALPKADLLCAGFPCQPFSRNGKWYNLNNMTVGDDSRANLFLYIIEYLKYHRPAVAVLENVSGIYKIKNKDGSPYLDSILDAIKECGYVGHCSILNSADFGLPQQRKRTFIVCFADENPAGRFVWPEKLERSLCINDILEENVDSKYYLENRWSGRNNIKLLGSRLSQLKINYEERELCYSNITKKISPVAMIYGDTPSGAPRQQDKLYSRFGISPTIATFELSIPNIDTPNWRVLTPRECARLQGFPENLKLPRKDSFAYKQIGNAVSVSVVEKILFQIKVAING